MVAGDVICAKCGATAPEEALICPQCHALLYEPPTVAREPTPAPTDGNRLRAPAPGSPDGKGESVRR